MVRGYSREADGPGSDQDDELVQAQEEKQEALEENERSWRTGSSGGKLRRGTEADLGRGGVMFQVVCMKLQNKGNRYDKLAGPFNTREEAEVALDLWKDEVYECNDQHVIEEVGNGPTE